MGQGLVEIVAQRRVTAAKIAATHGQIAASELLEGLADGGDDACLQFGFVALHVEIVLALGIELPLLFFLTALHGVALTHLVLKRGGGLRHHAHFVGEAGMGNGKRDVLIGHFAKRAVDVAERLRNATDDVESGGKRQHEDQRADRQRLHHIAANLRVQIIDVNAGHDHHLPGLKGKGIGALGVIIAFHTGLRAVEIRLAAAIAAKPHQFVTIGETLAVRLALEAFADALGIGVELHRHVVVVTEEIAVGGEAHGADSRVSLLHGLVARKRSGLFLVVEGLHDGDRRLHLRPQHAVAFLIDSIGGGFQLVKRRHGEGGHQGHHENDQLTGNGKVLHGRSQAFGIARLKMPRGTDVSEKGEAHDAR
ncbi:hypothetical protein D3C86_1312280 [compost metagenome]